MVSYDIYIHILNPSHLNPTKGGGVPETLENKQHLSRYDTTTPRLLHATTSTMLNPHHDTVNSTLGALIPLMSYCPVRVTNCHRLIH